ncbi:hypothetical protein [Streptomyces zagrosensis]|uniref:Pyridoxamine 5'-phosphate oxidase putative domain-containing protein n=1 Tax=Streptomyces zagrosensis TaxID=1042984 RepID=A0A7W9QAR7_9ACTN|nr:hypothetical protein [Streptomyces zagrosensis]MBB5936776.1 hypothetical protein [Streptomyces zagrosensis]
MTHSVEQALTDRALIEEATKKSGLVWVLGSTGATRSAPRALWHLWHEGAVTLVGSYQTGSASRDGVPAPGMGLMEQPLDGLGLIDGGTATVTVRSKDKGGRLVGWTAKVVELTPHSEAWAAAVAELKPKRLNAPDSEQVIERWARECRVLRLEPVEAPLAAQPNGSLAAIPPSSPATTRQPMPEALPKLLRRRARKNARKDPR